jgi:hypothetical protein
VPGLRDAERVSSRLWLLAVRPLSAADYYRTGLRGRWRYYLSWALCVAGVVALIITPFGLNYGFALGAFGVVGAVVLLAPEWSGIRRGRVVVERVPIKVGRIKADDATLVHHPALKDEVGIVDDAVEAALLTTRAKFAISAARTPIPTTVSRYVFDILSERARDSRTVFNGTVLRQNTQLSAGLLAADGTVELSRTNYFSMLCTNYMTGWSVRTRGAADPAVDGLGLVVDPDHKVRSLDDSRLANGIGVSTLAFTSDHKMVVILQHTLAQSSAGLYAPAGSGSLDGQDIRYARRRGLTDLKDLVAHGMRRELCEECRIEPSQLGDTEVIGYFRWLNKGAKPEYVGVTTVKLEASELNGRTIRLVETNYVREILTCDVDFARLRARPDSLTSVAVNYRQRMSMPLYMALRRLGHCLGAADATQRRLARWIGVTR